MNILEPNCSLWKSAGWDNHIEGQIEDTHTNTYAKRNTRAGVGVCVCVCVSSEKRKTEGLIKIAWGIDINFRQALFVGMKVWLLTLVSVSVCVCACMCHMLYGLWYTIGNSAHILVYACFTGVYTSQILICVRVCVCVSMCGWSPLNELLKAGGVSTCGCFMVSYWPAAVRVGGLFFRQVPQIWHASLSSRLSSRYWSLGRDCI